MCLSVLFLLLFSICQYRHCCITSLLLSLQEAIVTVFALLSFLHDRHRPGYPLLAHDSLMEARLGLVIHFPCLLVVQGLLLVLLSI